MRVKVCVHVQGMLGGSDAGDQGTQQVLRLNLPAEISQTIKEMF